jgi:hypothetical protein
MWKLKDIAEGAGKRENAIKMKAQLEGLKRKIPEILNIDVGINTVESVDACDIILSTEFGSAADLKTYQNHPDHLMVADFINKVRLERRAADYEIP